MALKLSVGGGALLAQAPQGAAAAAEQAYRQAEAVKTQQDLQKQAQEQQGKRAPADDAPPETYPGENADLGPQKLLKQKKRKPLFEFSSDTMFTWSSNVLSANVNEKETGVLAETMSLTLAPEAVDIGIGKLGIRTGYRHLFYMYDVAYGSDLEKSNVEMSTLFFGGNLSFLEKWNASLGIDYNRILFLPTPEKKWSYQYLGDLSKWKEGFVEWSPSWSLMRGIQLSEKLNVMMVYSGAYHFTQVDPDAAAGVGVHGNGVNRNDKLDNTLMASGMYSLNSKWMVQPSMRFTYTAYTQPVKPGARVHRRDQTTAPGLAVIWNPNPKLSLRASVGWEFRNSNLDDDTTPNYKKFEAAGGVSATIKF